MALKRFRVGDSSNSCINSFRYASQNSSSATVRFLFSKQTDTTRNDLKQNQNLKITFQKVQGIQVRPRMYSLIQVMGGGGGREGGGETLMFSPRAVQQLKMLPRADT